MSSDQRRPGCLALYTLHSPGSTTTIVLSEVESIVALPGRIIVYLRSGAKIDHGAADIEEAVAVHDKIVMAMVAMVQGSEKTTDAD